MNHQWQCFTSWSVYFSSLLFAGNCKQALYQLPSQNSHLYITPIICLDIKTNDLNRETVVCTENYPVKKGWTGLSLLVWMQLLLTCGNKTRLTRQNKPYRMVPTLTWQQKQHLYALGSRTFITPNLFILKISLKLGELLLGRFANFVPKMAELRLPVSLATASCAMQGLQGLPLKSNTSYKCIERPIQWLNIIKLLLWYEQCGTKTFPSDFDTHAQNDVNRKWNGMTSLSQRPCRKHKPRGCEVYVQECRFLTQTTWRSTI